MYTHKLYSTCFRAEQCLQSSSSLLLSTPKKHSHTSVATRKGKKAFPVATRKGKKAFPRLLFFLSQSPGSYFAMVDSGTSMHILQYRLFTSNLFEDHTAVSGFSDNTSQATHRGEFNCVVRAQNGRLFHLVDP